MEVATLELIILVLMPIKYSIHYLRAHKENLPPDDFPSLEGTITGISFVS